jgi:hypothetical protein
VEGQKRIVKKYAVQTRSFPNRIFHPAKDFATRHALFNPPDFFYWGTLHSSSFTLHLLVDTFAQIARGVISNLLLADLCVFYRK